MAQETYMPFLKGSQEHHIIFIQIQRVRQQKSRRKPFAQRT